MRTERKTIDKNQRMDKEGNVVKRCTKCKEEKSLDSFYKRSGYKSLYAHCKSCHIEMTDEKGKRRKNYKERNEIRRNNYRENPRKYLIRDKSLKYGISEEEVVAIISSPCSMCGAEESGVANKSMYIDHCHETGKVRGPLCHRCNNYVGWREKNKHLEDAYIRHINGPY